MKKLIMIALLIAVSTGAFAQTLKIFNTTTCPITVEIKAHDAALHPIFCSLESNLFTVPAGGVVSFPSVVSINTSIGWMGGALAGPGGVWDALKFLIAGGGAQLVGINCGATPLWTGTDCVGLIRNATWNATGGGNVVVKFF